MGADVSHGAPGDEGACLQGAGLWAESVLGLLVSQVEALVWLCTGAALPGVKDRSGLRSGHGTSRYRALGMGFALGGFTAVSPPVPQPDQEHPHLRMHDVLPRHRLPSARLRASLPPHDPAVPGDRHEEVWHVYI